MASLHQLAPWARAFTSMAAQWRSGGEARGSAHCCKSLPPASLLHWHRVKSWQDSPHQLNSLRVSASFSLPASTAYPPSLLVHGLVVRDHQTSSSLAQSRSRLNSAKHAPPPIIRTQAGHQFFFTLVLSASWQST